MTPSAALLVLDGSPGPSGRWDALLAGRGYLVHEAATAEAAMKQAAASCPDLVLLDPGFPDRVSFLIWLASNDRTRNVPILLIEDPAGGVSEDPGLDFDSVSTRMNALRLATRLRVHLELGRLRAQAMLRVSRETDERAAADARLQAEISERQRAESELERAEERYRTIFEESYLGIAWCDAQGRLKDANAAFLHLLGLKESAPILGTDIFAAPELPEDIKKRLRLGLTVSQELPVDFDEIKERRGFRAVHSGVHLLHLHVLPLGQGTEGLEGFLIQVRDVTSRRRSEAILASRSRLAEKAGDLTLDGLLQATLDEAEGLTGSCIGFYHFLDSDQNTLHLQAWSTRTEKEFCTAAGKGSHYPVNSAGIWADAVRFGKAQIHNDYPLHPTRKGLPDGHATVLREMVVPVFRQQRIVAILGVGNKPRPYVQSDVEIVQRLADLAWDLAERKRAEEALRHSRWEFQLIADYTYDWEFWEDPEGRLVYSSPSSERITGRPPAAIPDRNALEALIHPEDLDGWNEHRSLAGTEGTHGRLDFRIRHADGSYRWVAHVCQPVFVDGKFMGHRGSNREIVDPLHRRRSQKD